MKSERRGFSEERWIDRKKEMIEAKCQKNGEGHRIRRAEEGRLRSMHGRKNAPRWEKCRNIISGIRISNISRPRDGLGDFFPIGDAMTDHAN